MSLQSEKIDELMGALAKAQGEMSYASTDSSNPHFRSKYADLASVWQACREALAKNGLALVQTLDLAGESQVLITTLGHSSGQWMKSIMKLPVQKPGPQEIGSCISYCRRYSLAAMVGVYQDEDDAEKAEKPYRKAEEERKAQEAGKSPVNSQPVGTLTEKQIKLLEFKLSKFPEARAWICNEYKVDDVSKVNQSQLNAILKIFEAKEAKGST